MEERILEALEQVKAYTLLGVKSMMTVDDLALYTGYKPSYIRKMVHEGRLPCYKPMGKQLFFKKSEIDRLLESGRIPSIYDIINK